MEEKIKKQSLFVRGAAEPLDSQSNRVREGTAKSDAETQQLGKVKAPFLFLFGFPPLVFVA